MASISLTGTVHIFTYKEGLLSRVAHDLRLTASQFEITQTGEAVKATFALGALVVDGSMRHGRLDEGGLRAKDKAEIKQNIDRKILNTDRWPQAVFEGSYTGGRLSGSLTLRGRSAPVSCAVQTTDGQLSGRVTMVPSRWGIKPFKAALGAIKLKDHLEVAFELSPTP